MILSDLGPQEPVSFVFQRPQAEMIEVSVRPTRPGILTIKGMTWDLFDIPVSHALNYDLKDQSRKRTINFFNRFYVQPEAPLL